MHCCVGCLGHHACFKDALNYLLPDWGGFFLRKGLLRLQVCSFIFP